MREDGVEMLATEPKFFVGIGGSAGGLKAYQNLLHALPSDTEMTFIFVSHMSPTRESLLPEILSRSTKMPVLEASEGMRLRPNHVYVITPNVDLLIENGAFKVVTPRTTVGGAHKSVDYFLTSLADAFGPRAIGIVLSGADGDGSRGVKSIKENGGVTFAQDLSAQHESMPRTAWATGCVDFVLPPEGIARELRRLAA